MKYSPAQCKVCPFRPTSLPGWLGSYDAGSVFRSIWHGHPFFCHDSIDYAKPECLDEAVADPTKGKLCVGGLAFANRIHAPEREAKSPLILDARAKVRLRTDVECMGPNAFAAHHPDWKKDDMPKTKTKTKLAPVRAPQPAPLGKVKAHESVIGPCPGFDPTGAMVTFGAELPSAPFTFVETTLRLLNHDDYIPGCVPTAMLRWLVQAPPATLGSGGCHARAIYAALAHHGLLAFVPLGYRKEVERVHGVVFVDHDPANEGSCSRCGGTGDDPEIADCSCDCCGGSGVED